MTSSSDSSGEACRDHVIALISAMRCAIAAVAANDLRSFEQAVVRQQECAGALAQHAGDIRCLANSEPELIADFLGCKSLLSRILRRSSTTVQALLSVANPNDGFYSLESLSRR